MSHESCGGTPIRGMALPGEPLRILDPQRHVVRRIAEEASDIGPGANVQQRRSTLPVASTMPGIRWQPPQLYCLIKFIPR
jgi:hypothetical protein